MRASRIALLKRHDRVETCTRQRNKLNFLLQAVQLCRSARPTSALTRGRIGGIEAGPWRCVAISGDLIRRAHEHIPQEAMGRVGIEARMPDQTERIGSQHEWNLENRQAQRRFKATSDPLRDRQHRVGLSHQLEGAQETARATFLERPRCRKMSSRYPPGLPRGATCAWADLGTVRAQPGEAQPCGGRSHCRRRARSLRRLRPAIGLSR